MKDLLDKLSSYNIFNYLFPGVLFAVLADKLISYKLLIDNVVIGVFVYYFLGLVVSRVGSLILEPLLKQIRILHFTPYEDYVRASKLDGKIELLSEINNMYRTLSSVFICLLFLYFYGFLEKKYTVISDYSLVLAIILLMILFVFSYRKESDYIKVRVKRAIKTVDDKDA
jgi:hypothetical protein